MTELILLVWFGLTLLGVLITLVKGIGIGGILGIAAFVCIGYAIGQHNQRMKEFDR